MEQIVSQTMLGDESVCLQFYLCDCSFCTFDAWCELTEKTKWEDKSLLY